jgi:hypothetical protein
MLTLRGHVTARHIARASSLRYNIRSRLSSSLSCNCPGSCSSFAWIRIDIFWSLCCGDLHFASCTDPPHRLDAASTGWISYRVPLCGSLCSEHAKFAVPNWAQERRLQFPSVGWRSREDHAQVAWCAPLSNGTGMML